MVKNTQEDIQFCTALGGPCDTVLPGKEGEVNLWEQGMLKQANVCSMWWHAPPGAAALLHLADRTNPFILSLVECRAYFS